MVNKRHIGSSKNKRNFTVIIFPRLPPLGTLVVGRQHVRCPLSLFCLFLEENRQLLCLECSAVKRTSLGSVFRLRSSKFRSGRVFGTLKLVTTLAQERRVKKVCTLVVFTW